MNSGCIVKIVCQFGQLQKNTDCDAFVVQYNRSSPSPR